MYSIYAKHFRCKVKKYDDKEFQFKLENLSKIISSKTKIVFLANPNNPTGSIFYKNELIKFLNKITLISLFVRLEIPTSLCQKETRECSK